MRTRCVLFRISLIVFETIHIESELQTLANARTHLQRHVIRTKPARGDLHQLTGAIRHAILGLHELNGAARHLNLDGAAHSFAFNCVHLQIDTIR